MENGDDWAKGEYTKLKRESWNAPTLTKAHPNSPKSDTPEDLTQVSSSELNLA